MKIKIALNSCLVVLMLIVLLSLDGFYISELYAQKQKEEAVYFLDGTSARGIIIEINREKIRILQKDGSIIERSSKKIYRFSSDRPFRVIYKQTVESEIKKPVKSDKPKSKAIEQGCKKWQSKSGGMISTTVLGQNQKQNKKNPFSGLWESKMGSIVKIDGNQGVIIYTLSEHWKKFIHKITIKNIRQQDDKWVADEWFITNENNMWIEAEWELVGNKIKRYITFKGKKLETFFVKIGEDFSAISADAKAYYNRGIAYRRIGQYIQAIYNLNKALEIDPRYAKAYYNRGIAYRHKGLYDKAISDYTKAIEIDPRYVVAYYNRGVAYQDKGQYDKAISDFNKAIELNPMDAAVYCNRGITYFIKEEYDNAWDDFKEAQVLGGQIHPEFLRMLREASGKEI